jgi:hypothetical protein
MDPQRLMRIGLAGFLTLPAAATATDARCVYTAQVEGAPRSQAP